MKVANLIKKLHNIEEYPEQAIKQLLIKKDEAIPHLLQELTHFVTDYKRVKGYFHLYAIHILSAFREQKAFPLIIKIAQFPADWIDILFEEDISLGFQMFFVSTYNGNLEAIKQIIENETADMRCRNAALGALAGLMISEQISRLDLVEYLKQLIHSDLINDYELATGIAQLASEIHPKELYEDIVKLYKRNLVDESHINLTEVEQSLNMNIQECIQENLSGPDYIMESDKVVEYTKGTSEDFDLDCLRNLFESTTE